MFIMISSVAPDGDSPLRRIIDTTYPDGTRVIKLLNWIQACQPCIARNMQDRCSHLERPPQHFQSFGGQDRLQALLSQNSGAYNREMGNQEEVPTTTMAFNKEWVDFMTQNEYDSPESVSHLFITIDPSSGKDGNYYALASMIFVRGTCVVCYSSILLLYLLLLLLYHTETNP